MLTRKSLARTAAATAGLALVATGAIAPASADQGKGADRGQSHAAQAKGDKADRKAGKSAKAEKGQQTAAAAKAEKSQSKGRSADAPHGNAYGHDKDAKAEAKSEARAEKSEDRGQGAGEKTNNGLGDERGNGHTPVTVCHAIGNGGYIEITFDENALKNHLANHMQHKGHMDYVLDEEGETCPETPAVAGQESDENKDVEKDVEEGVTPEVIAGSQTKVKVVKETVTRAQVAGVEAFRARTGAAVEAPAAAGEATVAGAEASAPAAVPAAGPVAGILPQTGAAPMALAAAAGLGLVGAGATMVARRRREI